MAIIVSADRCLLRSLRPLGLTDSLRMVLCVPRQRRVSSYASFGSPGLEPAAARPPPASATGSSLDLRPCALEASTQKEWRVPSGWPSRDKGRQVNSSSCELLVQLSQRRTPSGFLVAYISR